jgi:hypothetical protein
MNDKDEYATVDEVIAILSEISRAGKGHYIVDCNDEYWLARKDEKPIVNDSSGIVSLGGYC